MNTLSRVVLPLTLGAAAWAAACGSPAEPPKAPPTVKVDWGNAEDSSKPGATGQGSDESTTTGNEIDLDALAEKPAEKERFVNSEAAEPAPAVAEPPPLPKEPEPVAATPEPELEPEAAAEPAAPMPLAKEIRAAVKSKEKEPPPRKKPATRKRAATPPTEETAAVYSGPSPCKATRFSVPRVQEACASGGRNAAKAVMKDAVGKALAAGASLKCADCHTEQREYTLKKDAVAHLKKWLGG